MLAVFVIRCLIGCIFLVSIAVIGQSLRFALLERNSVCGSQAAQSVSGYNHGCCRLLSSFISGIFACKQKIFFVRCHPRRTRRNDGQYPTCSTEQNERGNWLRDPSKSRILQRRRFSEGSRCFVLDPRCSHVRTAVARWNCCGRNGRQHRHWTCAHVSTYGIQVRIIISSFFLSFFPSSSLVFFFFLMLFFLSRIHITNYVIIAESDSAPTLLCALNRD